MNVKVSVIVPLYNTEAYIAKCLDSILQQTFTDIEVIVINDGSTDNSGKIARKYALKDRRIKLLEQENAGPGATRNRGIDEAKGEYISFVDCDDYIHPEMLKQLYDTAIKTKADLVICNYKKVAENDRVIEKMLKNKQTITSGIEMLQRMYEPASDYAKFVVAWNKLYRRQLFHHIRYGENILYEDETVAHKLYYFSKKVTYIDDVLYYYVQRKGSVVHSPIDVVRFDRIIALKQREQFFQEMKEKKLQRKALLHFIEIFFKEYYAVKRTLTGVEKELKHAKRYFDQSLWAILIHKDIMLRRKLFYCLFSISPKAFDVVQKMRAKNSEFK